MQIEIPLSEWRVDEPSRRKDFRMFLLRLAVRFNADEAPSEWYIEVPFNHPPLQPPVCFDHPQLPFCLVCKSEMYVFGAGTNWNDKQCSIFFICKNNDDHRVEAYPKLLSKERIQELRESIKQSLTAYLIDEILAKQGPVGPVLLLLKKDQSIDTHELTPFQLGELTEMLLYFETCGLIHNLVLESCRISWIVDDDVLNQLQ